MDVPKPPTPTELRAFRERTGWSQKTLALRLGEAGRRSPPAYLSLALELLETRWDAECGAEQQKARPLP